ncbi:MAG: HlyD family secretion protein, partial [Gammaproteobacteria bacterium]|nr:HlyD family secretion protein [Gammaproteobacteria bacterium]
YIQAHVVNEASQVTGQVQAVLVHNQQQVAKNQLLFMIDPKPFQLIYEKAQAELQNTQLQVQAGQNAVDTAKAQLAQQQAQLLESQKNYDRIMKLVKETYYSKASADTVVRQLTVAKQSVIAAQDQLKEAQAKRGTKGDANTQIQAAKDAVAQAALNLQYTKVYAPSAGQLAQLTLQPGQTITAYQSLFSLVDTHTWWAMANMKETDLSRIRAGQKVDIVTDMYPFYHFQGLVKSIGAGSGATFSLLPTENATGNWVKVTQRFPTRIQIINPNPKYPLRVGASCTVKIDTQS